MATEKDIFESAIEIENLVARNDYLAEACGNDVELRKRVTGLLAFYDDEPVFLSEEQLLADRTVEEELIGQRVGSYTLREPVGEGGFGTVFRAEQTEPIRRTVAIKIVKLGMDTRQVMARFDAERQALAMMDHPYIARVLDCGATHQGRPFFAMDLVEGTPITEYCDLHQLTTTDRLRLFSKVCRAIQHAHQKGIIHRDLKPSNVLVTREGESDVPHVIDFGVAKAIGDKLSDHTNVTRQDQIIGTPQYMSPEQADQSEKDVDTRTDIYSLGVLLYEMLTGDTPHDSARLKRSALDEMIRIIREDDAPTPSSRIRSLNESAATVAERRSTHPTDLGRILQGELDWIVMKALEKDRSRRFQTASELSADIDRYLDGEPVLSGPPSKSYRFMKLIRKYRGVAAATAIVVAALSLGLTVAMVGLLRANEARNAAVASERTAQTLLTMLRSMLEIDPVTGRGRDLTVGEMLDSFVEGLPNLSKQPDTAAEIHGILASSYLRLDFLHKSIRHRRLEYSYRRELLGDNHKEVATVARRLSNALHMIGERAEAFRFGEISMRILDNLEDESPESIVARGQFAELLIAVGETERAERLIREAMKVAKNHETTTHTTSLQDALGLCLCKQGRFDEGIRVARGALERTRQLPTADEEDIAWSQHTFGSCLKIAGRLDEAAVQYEQALGAMRRIHGPTSTFNPAVGNLADIYHRLYKFEEAERLLEASFDLSRLSDSVAARNVFAELVFIKLDRGNYNSAEDLCRQVINAAGDSGVRNDTRALASVLLAFSTNRYDTTASGRISSDVVVETEDVTLATPDIALARAWALAHVSQHDLTRADACLALAEPLANSIFAAGPKYLTALSEHVAALGHQVARHDQQTTVEYYRRARDTIPRHRLFFSAEIERTFARYLELLGDDGSLQEAREILESGVEWRKSLVPAESVFLADARMRLASHLMKHGDSIQDRQKAQRLLHHPSLEVVVGERPARDYFRVEWLRLREQLDASRGAES